MRAGVGDALPDAVVRLILALKINALARGYSGVTMAVVDALLALLQHEVYPVIPAQGSVGASGDLAPLAHLSTVLLGIGDRCGCAARSCLRPTAWCWPVSNPSSCAPRKAWH